MTSTPRSISRFWMSMTSRSLPGMAQDEKMTRSPAFSAISGCSSRAMRAMAARASPWLPVQSSTTLERGRVLYSFWSRKGSMPSSIPSSRAMPEMRCSALPDITTWRPAFCAARATEITRPTLEAKVVTATRCGASAISASRSADDLVLAGAGAVLQALVESQISAMRARPVVADFGEARDIGRRAANRIADRASSRRCGRRGRSAW